MASVLVTGGAGLIGSHLCRRLLSIGHEVLCFDNLSTGSGANIADMKGHERFSFYRGDANTADLDSVFDSALKKFKKFKKSFSFDYVFHLAAVVGVKKTHEEPLAVLSDIKGIMRILELCRKHRVKKAVFASSSEVYGHPTELPEKEDGRVSPHIPYAATKLVGEHWFEQYYKVHGLRTSSLRFFNSYGPCQRGTSYGFVVGIFISQVLHGRQPTVFGNGKQSRDFMYVEDTVDAAITCLERKQSDGQSINIATGIETSVLSLAETIIELCGKKDYKKDSLHSLKPAFVEERPGEIMRRVASTDKMKRCLGFTPKHTLRQGLQKTIEYYRTKRADNK